MAETEYVISEDKPLLPPPPPPPLPVSLLLPSSKKMSNACELDLQRVARNKETDSDIFALGEAASQLDIDDVLSGVGSDLSELLNADDGSVTSTSCQLALNDHVSLKPPSLDKYTTVQVTTIQVLLFALLVPPVTHFDILRCIYRAKSFDQDSDRRQTSRGVVNS